MVKQGKIYIDFGKYTGKQIKNIPQSYRLWLLREKIVTRNKNEELWGELIKQVEKYKSS